MLTVAAAVPKREKYSFLPQMTGEVPHNVSSLLLLKSPILQHLHLSRPPVALLERLLETGSKVLVKV